MLKVTTILILTDLPRVAAKSGTGFKYLVNFSNSDEFSFSLSVQAKSVLVLLTCHKLCHNFRGFIILLDGGTSGRESIVQKCYVFEGEKKCRIVATLVNFG
jgi:hypothetical protein